ncbi:hypothetical protein DOK67_0000859 [Enterococcus sp. DIV0212c]|uniref:DUF1307 domain-containing protein n=1 Tax=Enterococcus sp. DIV0212c TaxID=2230867 RepID=UPI001A9AFABE|nr:DUF1307 domain-containing protein [Enterococcus sp. DIV0212c]MBO1353738.1 DUF1307 domain-containing protein [Enterococcus sp. DIV0212c]
MYRKKHYLKSLIASSILLATSFSLIACGSTEKRSEEAETSETTQETKADSNNDSLEKEAEATEPIKGEKNNNADGTKTVVYEKEYREQVERTILTFKDDKLLKEVTEKIFPYADSNAPMTKEEAQANADNNKQYLANIPGVTYDEEFLPKDISKRTCTIEFDVVDIDKVSWLTYFNADTTYSEAKTSLENREFIEAQK